MENAEVDALIYQLKDACIGFIKFNEVTLLEMMERSNNDVAVQRLREDYRKLGDMIITIQRAEMKLGRGLPINSYSERASTV